MIAIKAANLQGSMADLIARKDWAGTALGSFSQWPPQLRTTIDIMLDARFPMFLFWGRDMLCFYNDAYRPYLGNGGKHPSIIGTPCQETSPESWPLIENYLTKVMATGESFAMEDFTVPLFRNGNTDRWMGTLSFSPVMGEENVPLGVLTVCFETTDKEAFLNKSREREEEMHFILDAAELGTWDYNPKTKTFRGNRRLKEWFGLPDTENVDIQLAINAIIPGDQDKLLQSIAQSVERRSGGNHHIVYTIVHPVSGVRRIVRAKGKAFFNANENIAYRFNGTLQDITDEVLAKQSLQESEQNFRDLIDNSPLAMCLLAGERYEVLSINKNMLTMLGKTSAETLNKPFFDTAPPDSVTELRHILEGVRNTGESFSAHAMPMRMPKEDRLVNSFIDFAYEPIFGDSNQVTAVIVTATDVTAQVLLQKKLDQKKEEIKKQMLKASIDAQEKERELISNELHDNVNQLLACTKLFLELIQPENDIASVAVSRGSAFIGEAMDEIRDISHALNPNILNFVGLFKSIREMLEKLNRTHAIIFSFDSSGCSKEWKPNPEIELTVFRIIQKQVANIIQHSGAVSADINLSSGPDFMELLISDDGKGFDPAASRKGLGLLNIINRAELMNGSVSLQSAPGNGCQLKVRIPARGRIAAV